VLRLLDGLIVVAEIGARIVHAFVEKQPIEVVAEIVVMGDVLLCLADSVGLLEALQATRHSAQHLLQRIGAEGQPIDREECQEVPEARVLEAHAAVHVGLARMEFRVEKELMVKRTIREPHGDTRPWGPSEDVGLAICINHLQHTDADKRLEHMRQGKHSGLSASTRRQRSLRIIEGVTKMTARVANIQFRLSGPWHSTD
jgi:hypothetical protein